MVGIINLIIGLIIGLFIGLFMGAGLVFHAIKESWLEEDGYFYKR